MRWIVAPDSFKGSLTAAQAAEAMALGIERADPWAAIEKIPLADGGEGTVEALVEATGGRRVTVRVRGPLGESVEATFGILGDGTTAVIEMAAASGLVLVPPEQRNPLRTTTYGTGELIRAALDRGCRRLLIGIGGSATNDAGLGMAAALGVRFFDGQGRLLGHPGGNLAGQDLLRLARIDARGLDPRLQEAEVLVACDVTNPLYGPEGAAYVYAPQKGATPAMVEELDEGLRRFAEVVRRDLGKDVAALPGAGAAGGLGAGLVAFLNAHLERGIRLVLEVTRFVERIRGAHAIFTGEGCIDRQALYGKVLLGVATAAQEQGIPVFALGGSILPDARPLMERGVTAFFSLTNGPMSLQEAMEHAAPLLADLAEQVARTFLAGKGMPDHPSP